MTQRWKETSCEQLQRKFTMRTQIYHNRIWLSSSWVKKHDHEHWNVSENTVRVNSNHQRIRMKQRVKYRLEYQWKEKDLRRRTNRRRKIHELRFCRFFSFMTNALERRLTGSKSGITTDFLLIILFHIYFLLSSSS